MSIAKRQLAPERTQTSYRTRKTGETLVSEWFASPSLEDPGQEGGGGPPEQREERWRRKKRWWRRLLRVGERVPLTMQVRAGSLNSCSTLRSAVASRRLFFRSVDHAWERSLDPYRSFSEEKRGKTETILTRKLNRIGNRSIFQARKAYV